MLPSHIHSAKTIITRSFCVLVFQFTVNFTVVYMCAIHFVTILVFFVDHYGLGHCSYNMYKPSFAVFCCMLICISSKLSSSTNVFLVKCHWDQLGLSDLLWLLFNHNNKISATKDSLIILGKSTLKNFIIQ